MDLQQRGRGPISRMQDAPSGGPSGVRLLRTRQPRSPRRFGAHPISMTLRKLPGPLLTILSVQILRPCVKKEERSRLAAVKAVAREQQFKRAGHGVFSS